MEYKLKLILKETNIGDIYTGVVPVNCEGLIPLYKKNKIRRDEKIAKLRLFLNMQESYIKLGGK